MKILQIITKSKWLITLCIIGALVGTSLVAAAVSPIWSNVSTSTLTPPTWPGTGVVGTVVVSNNATIANTGDTITLTATLHPLPTQYQQQQNVTFWYSTTSIALDSNGNPTNPNQLTNLPASNTNSGVTTIAGVAHLSFIAQVTGTYYFIAEVASPT